MLFGAHMSTGGGVWKALERGRGIACEIIQIFVENTIESLWRARKMCGNGVSFYV